MKAPKEKERSYGFAPIAHRRPGGDVVLDFEGVLYLKAAVDLAAWTLSRLDRSTREGKRAGVNLATADVGRGTAIWLTRTTVPPKGRRKSGGGE
jgi:hypothetical protein